MGPFSSEESMRYRRQLALPEIGVEGQRKLRGATVLVAGVGGLGCVSALYLAAAGVGRLRLVDRDLVELDNLNRQILHWSKNVGTYKTASAADKLRELNPNIVVEPFKEEIAEDRLARHLEGCAVVVDGTDNLRARRIVNRAVVRFRVPFVFGGVDRFTGMVTTFVPGETPCLDCLFPEPDAPEILPAVIGPLPGMIGAIQALEAIKRIVGMPGGLAGRLLLVRGDDMRFQEIGLDPNPACPVCGAAGREGVDVA